MFGWLYHSVLFSLNLLPHRAMCSFLIINNKPITKRVQNTTCEGRGTGNSQSGSVTAGTPTVPHPPCDSLLGIRSTAAMGSCKIHVRQCQTHVVSLSLIDLSDFYW